MKILSWNIRHGGGSRIPRIQAIIAGHNPNVLVLPEFRNNASGAALRQWLVEFEYHQSVPATQLPAHNTALLSAKTEFVPIAFPELGAESRRCIAGRFGSLTILAFYFATMEAKRPVFEFIKGLPKKMLTSETLLIGDFNTGVDIGTKGGWISHWSRNLEQSLAAVGLTFGDSAIQVSANGHGSNRGDAISAIASIML